MSAVRHTANFLLNQMLNFVLDSRQIFLLLNFSKTNFRQSGPKILRLKLILSKMADLNNVFLYNPTPVETIRPKKVTVTATGETTEFDWEFKYFRNKCQKSLDLDLPLSVCEFTAGQNIDLRSRWSFTLTLVKRNLLFGRGLKPDEALFLNLKLVEYNGKEKALPASYGVAIKRANLVDHYVNYQSMGSQDMLAKATRDHLVISLSHLAPIHGGITNEGTMTLHITFNVFALQTFDLDRAFIIIPVKYTEPLVFQGPSQCKSPPLNIGHDLADVLELGTNSDVTLITKDGERVQSHKVILSARSPVFGAMFASNMKESATGEVKLEDIGIEALEVLLAFMYTDRVAVGRLDLEIYKEVLHAADKYSLTKLIDYFDKTMGKKCTTDNALTLYKIARLHNLPIATRKITKFIKADVVGVLEKLENGN